jgi:Tannase-like family of unknown function (DUF6351)
VATASMTPGLLDGGNPQYSYPDMVTQTIHIGDCELLEHWMDLQVREPIVEVAGLDESLGARGPVVLRHGGQPLLAADAVARSARIDRVRQRLAPHRPASSGLRTFAIVRGSERSRGRACCGTSAQWPRMRSGGRRRSRSCRRRAPALETRR